MSLKRFVSLMTAIFPLMIIFSCAVNEDISVSYYESDGMKNVYVAHAGGVCDGYIGTNSLEAMIESAGQGYKFIEVDIMKTSDGQYVLNHDWEYMGSRVAFAENGIVDYDEFIEYKIYNKFTPVGLEHLIKFLDEYEDVRIITDTKDENYSFLRYIAKHYKKYINRFVPQVYAFEDYSSVKRIGFKNVIITLYTMPYNIISDPDYIYKQAKKLRPYAVTVPETLLSDEYISKLRTDEIKYFTHTINDAERAEEMFNKGIYGVYTDILFAGNYGEIYDERVSEINWRISELEEEQKDLLKNRLIYNYESEICITDGKAELIYASILLTPVKKNDGSIYFPLAKTVSYLGGTEYLYIADEQAITFEYGGNVYRVGRNGSIPYLKEKPVVYCDAYYCSDSFFKYVFDCSVYSSGDYVIVSRDNRSAEDELYEVLGMITGTDD